MINVDFLEKFKATCVSRFKEEKYGDNYLLRPGFHPLSCEVPFLHENLLVMYLRGPTNKMQ